MPRQPSADYRLQKYITAAMRAFSSTGAVALRDRRCFSIHVSQGSRRQRQPPQGSLRRLPVRKAERFGMGPAVVLGQGLAEAAEPVRHGAVADLAAGERQLGNGDGEAAGR